MIEKQMPRKLRAILAADVEGYSRLMGDDDTGAIRLLSGYRSIIFEKVGAFGGALFAEAGDGFLSEFENAEDAVLCGVDIQKSIAKSNARRRKQAMWFRIGISLGDIIDHGKNKYGNAINIASRIQSIAEPGGLCVTHPVFEQVANKLPYAFDEIGPTSLKNISRPVDLVKVRWAETPSRRAPLRVHAGSASDHPTIALLPFGAHGIDRKQSYLVDGLVEEVITELSKYRWLSVVSKGSSFAYRSRKVDLRLVARELGVRYLVEGSLRRDRGKFRIILHLVSGETGEELWSDRFDRATREVFELQEDVVRGIAGAIEPNIKSAEIRRSRRKPTENLSAYDYYLQALPYRASIDRAGNEIALKLLKKAIALDPHFAPALALASISYATRKDQGWGAIGEKDVERALRLARAAIAADDRDPTALCLAAHTMASFGSDLDAAIALIDRSLSINPSSFEGWARSSMVRIYAGDLSTARRHARTAIGLSPLDERLFLPLCALGYCDVFSGRPRQAIVMARRALLGRQRPPMAYIILLAAFHLSGAKADLADAAKQFIKTAPRFRAKEWVAQSCFVRQDQRVLLQEAFRAARLPA